MAKVFCVRGVRNYDIKLLFAPTTTVIKEAMTADTGRTGHESITSAQIRDYTNRVMRPLAGRQSGGRDWSICSFALESGTPELSQRLSFRGEYDDLTCAYDYEVDMATIAAFEDGDEWNAGFVQDILRRSHNEEWCTEEDDEDDELILSGGGSSEYGVETDSYKLDGFYSVVHSYRFRVPGLGGVCESSKYMMIDFLNSGGDDIESIIGHYPGAHLHEVETEDLERLRHYGEAMLNAAAYEAELSAVTVADLSLILAALQSVGLVRSTCKVLSSRVV